MSIGLIVERQPRESTIGVDEWLALLVKDSELRHRHQPYWATNPVTGHQIKINVGEADAEFLRHEQWEPFLRFQRGKLVTEYSDELANPADLRRRKIVEIAVKLGARICTDVDDEPLDW